MTYDGLEKRIDKLLAYIGKPAEQQRLEDAFTFDLFTTGEQERLHAFLDQAQLSANWHHDIPILHDLTIEEQDQLESWLVLHQALADGNEAEASRARCYLELTGQDKERIYREFMAIDERLFVDVAHCIEAPTVQWGGATHYLYRQALRNDKLHLHEHVARSRYLRRFEIDSMWLWIAQAA